MKLKISIKKKSSKHENFYRNLFLLPVFKLERQIIKEINHIDTLYRKYSKVKNEIIIQAYMKMASGYSH